MKKVVSLQTTVFKAFLALGLATALLLGGVSPVFSGDFEMGQRSYNQGNFALAIQYFRTALLRDRDNANIRYYLADALVKDNRLAEAQAEYQYILANAPDSQAARLSVTGLSRLRSYLVASFDTGIRTQKDVGVHLGADRVVGLPAEGENYLDLITDEGRYVRWSLRKMPIKIYVERSPRDSSHFQPAFINEVYKGMDVWVRALGNQISYERVSSPEEADIRVFWLDTIDTRGNVSDTGTTYTAGITQSNIDKDILRYMEVRIATRDVEGEAQSSTMIHAVAVHELGHAMGLSGHTPVEGDIMYARNQGVVVPSKRDLNTIILLYSRAPDITNLPPGEIDKVPNQGDEIADRVDDEITRLEGELEQSGTVLNYLNVATAYLRKGKRMYDTDRQGAHEWYGKALQTTNKAIALEPRNHASYLKRCFIYQEMDKPELALTDAEEAIRLAPKESPAYLQKAWILGGMGKSGQANSALDQYLALNPTAAASADVKRARDHISENALD